MALVFYVLMLALLCGGSAKVAQDFERECGQFFANGTSPTRFSGPQYKQICQSLEGVIYYATFYDTINRIPMYSAYEFKGIKNCTRLDKWYIEPQLDDIKSSPNMGSDKDIQGLGVHQARNEDYKNSGYHKGHLAPVYQASTQTCADATFTLTNAAPQNSSFNQGQWRNLEKGIANKLSSQCPTEKYSAYIVTGVVPSNSTMNNRVKVPSHFWTAFCCLDNNKKCKISSGFIGKNENVTPQNKTVQNLETELAMLYKVSSFVLFGRSTEHPAKKRKYTFKTKLD